MRIRTTSSQNGTNSLAYKGPRGQSLDFVGQNLEVSLKDGRAVRVPLNWYPRLERATNDQRRNYRWIGNGIGINWPDIDEHISIEGLLNGIKAPRSIAYLSGKLPVELIRERKRIEASYNKPKKSIPGKRASRAKTKART